MVAEHSSTQYNIGMDVICYVASTSTAAVQNLQPKKPFILTGEDSDKHPPEKSEDNIGSSEISHIDIECIDNSGRIFVPDGPWYPIASPQKVQSSTGFPGKRQTGRTATRSNEVDCGQPLKEKAKRLIQELSSADLNVNDAAYKRWLNTTKQREKQRREKESSKTAKSTISAKDSYEEWRKQKAEIAALERQRILRQKQIERERLAIAHQQILAKQERSRDAFELWFRVKQALESQRLTNKKQERLERQRAELERADRAREVRANWLRRHPPGSEAIQLHRASHSSPWQDILQANPDEIIDTVAGSKERLRRSSVQKEREVVESPPHLFEDAAKMNRIATASYRMRYKLLIPSAGQIQ